MSFSIREDFEFHEECMLERYANSGDEKLAKFYGTETFHSGLSAAFCDNYYETLGQFTAALAGITEMEFFAMSGKKELENKFCILLVGEGDN